MDDDPVTLNDEGSRLFMKPSPLLWLLPLAVQSILATGVFTALFLSAWPAPEKAFFGLAFVCLVFYIEYRGTYADSQWELTCQLLFALEQAIIERAAARRSRLGDVVRSAAVRAAVSPPEIWAFSLVPVQQAVCAYLAWLIATYYFPCRLAGRAVWSCMGSV